MVLVGGSSRTSHAHFRALGEWGVITKVSVIDVMVKQGYIVRVDAHRCQITPKGVEAMGGQRNSLGRRTLRLPDTPGPPPGRN
jgi:hypothetical protein